MKRGRDGLNIRYSLSALPAPGTRSHVSPLAPWREEVLSSSSFNREGNKFRKVN